MRNMRTIAIAIACMALVGCRGIADPKVAKGPVVPPVATAQVQYKVSLYAGPATEPIGDVQVDTGGVVTVTLTQPIAGTTVQFCPAPSQKYDCFPVVGKMPSGSWAGDFQVLDGTTVLGSTDVPIGTAGVYRTTLVPVTAANGSGGLLYDDGLTQADGGGTLELANGILHVVTTAPGSWTVVQCPVLYDSGCYELGDGTSPFDIATDGIPGDVFRMDSDTQDGFIGGVLVP